MRLALASIMLAGQIQRVFAAQDDPASLERMADIETLLPVPWWPLAPGWYLLMAAVLVLLITLGVTTRRRRRRNAYRSAALAELDSVVRGPVALPRIAQILKRTALVRMPRQSIAGLSGKDWLHWLLQSGNGVTFTKTARQLLSEKVYRTGQPSEQEIEELANVARAWIRRHQVNPASRAEKTEV